MNLHNDWRSSKAESMAIEHTQTRAPYSALLIGVTGGTGAGKTTFARRLAKILASRQTVTLLDLESYYKDFSFLSLPERQYVNFDDPDSLDLIRFKEDLKRLRQGRDIVKPVYDLVTYTRHAGGPVVVPGAVVIIEGLWVFSDEHIRSLFDLKIYIDTPAEIRLRRRLERDVRERGRALAGAIDHYMSSILPRHERLIEPIKDFCDFTIRGWEDTESCLNEMAVAIQILGRTGPQRFDLRRIENEGGCSSAEQSEEHMKG